MTNRELNQLYWLNREIARDKQRLQELIAAATDTASKITGLPHASGVSDKTALAVEIAYLKGVIESKIQQSYYEYNRLITYINSIEDSYIRQILTLRYVNGLSWQQIAHHMGGGNTSDGVRMACNRYLRSH